MSLRPAPKTAPPLLVVRIAMALRRFLLRAADAVVPGYLAIYDRMMGAPMTVLLHAACDLRIAERLEERPLTAAELAAQTGADTDALNRMMGALVSIHVFRREGADRYANNRTSRALIHGRNASIPGFARFFGYPPMLHAWADFPRTLREGGNAFQRVHGQTCWEWLAGHDEARAAFVDGMSSMTEQAAPSIAAAYPFAEVKRLCDVGGGTGMVLAAVLAKHGHLKGVLYDAPTMIAEAPPRLEVNGVLDRVERVPGSFFDAVPKGCDAYLLKTVLHNWPDEGALRILRNCRAAMEPGHKLIVVDFLDQPDAESTLVPYMDIVGMNIFADGRERSKEEFGRLFEAAGFRMGRVFPIPGCQAIYEGVAVA